MPQMAPMWWFTLFLMFITSLILVMMMMYFQLNYNPTQPSSKNKINKNLNWKW